MAGKLEKARIDLERKARIYGINLVRKQADLVAPSVRDAVLLACRKAEEEVSP